MNKKNMQEMAMRYYQGFFTNRWGETWYASALESLIESAIDNEQKYKKESEDKYFALKRLHDKSWEPYELIIETQAGVVLVMCQTYITTVVSKVGYFYKDYEALFKKKVVKIGVTKRELMANYGPRIKNVEYSATEVIDALSNYFKHHEEWGGTSNGLPKQAERTAEIVSSVGARLGLSLWYSRNITKCLEKLNINNMNELFLLPQIIDDWKFDVGKGIKELDLQLIHNV